ncbi:MAG: calcineurin-like phosphoesterase C-terminal domain-containing protein [Bacteroidales bacterium]|nr:calcineurin-like phosphoesterase C-terminal domain-containing protein [Bacteroidales bacterium]
MKRFFIPVIALLAFSCTREIAQDSPVIPGDEVTISAEIAETRTALGQPEGSVYPNLWSAGDMIAVNGVTSEPLGSEAAGASKAGFTLTGVQAPFRAVCPASAAGNWSDGGATVTIPSHQTWQSGTYDPAAFVMLGSSETESVSFSTAVTLVKIVPNAAAGVKIASVALEALGDGVYLSGSFNTDFSAVAPTDDSAKTVSVSSSEGVPAGEPIILAMAPADLSAGGLSVVITDTDGGRMVRTAMPSKAYVAGRMYKVEIDYVPDQTVSGNIFGTVTCGGAGVPGVLISDGIDIVQTDADGRYSLQSDKKWNYVFMTIPSGYEAPVDGVLPKIWKPLSKGADEAEQVDFELVQSDNDNYTLFLFGDMHLARRTGDLAQFEKVAGSIRQHMDATPGKVYVLTLGDMTWDMYWIANNYSFGDYLTTVNSYFFGIPFFHTMGNHDNEMEVGGDYLKCLKYTQNLAPDYYSFNLGRIHYIVLDNMDFTDVEPGQDNRSKYAKNYTAEQLEWLKKDLSYVDKSTPVFVTSHEPLARPSGLSWNETLNGQDADLDTFIGIFDGYNVRFLSGHTHNLFNRNWTPTFTEHNSGAVCASWWWSGYITPGIHVAQDGAPGGFTKWTVNGTDCTHYYQAACQSPEYQFRAYDMNQVKATITEDLSSHSGYPKYYNHIQSYGDNVILVNVWDYDDDWKVEISEDGNPLQVSEVGVYDPLHIYAMTIPRLNKYNTTTFSTAKWRHFFQATASAADTPVTVKVTDRYGKVYTEEMTRPKAFSVSEYKNETERVKPVAQLHSSSSSSLVFSWTVGGTAAEDAEVPYKLELFKDASCTDLQISFDVPANADCWGGNPIRFTFGGLQPATSYWFKVTNAKNGDASEPVEGTTESFTVVDPSTVSNAAAGDVILAEDFSEIGWGADMLATAGGFIPARKTLDLLSGNQTIDDGKFHLYNTTGSRIYGESKVTSDKRLFKWGFFGNSSVYSYAGYLRVGSSESGARTHIVSPPLSGIPDGKLATIDVTVTSSKYDSSENDVAVFVNDFTSLTLALAPDQTESTSPKFSSQGGKFTGASLEDGYPLEAQVKNWTTKTIRIEGVTANSCLLFGSYQNVDKKNRFFLNDVKVQVVSIDDIPEKAPVEASLVTSSSSTLIFTWTEGNGAAADVANAYTATLYKDKACTIVDQSFDFPADLGAWRSKQPKYVFGGLEPSTDYWLKVKDTTNNLESDAVKATTDAFTVVEMPESITGTGVALAEDFGEIRWEFDHITTAVGFRPNDNSSFANTEVKTSETNTGSYIYNGYHYSGGGEMTFKGPATALNNSRLKDWLSDTNVYIHPGYLKLGTSSSRGWILTPEFKIPDGKTATVTVTITAARLNSSQDADWGVVVLNPELAKANPSAHTAAFDWPDDTDQTLYQEISFSNTDWATKSVSGLVLHNGDRIAFGGKHTGDSKKGRAYISDITVTVTAIEDGNRTTKVSVIGDSISTFKGWCDTTKGGAYYPKSDGDVSSVDKTWWYNLIYNKMSTGKFEKNISAGNTTVVQNSTGDSSAYWYGWDFGTRLQTLGIGDPDIVLIHGGTNDYGHTSWYGTSEELITGVSMSESAFPSSSQAALDAIFAAADAATTVSAADALDGSNFCSAYTRLIKMVQTRHPSAKIVCVIGDYLRGGQGDAIKLIAQHFGDSKVRVADLLGDNVSIPKYSNPHPNASGMEAMASYIYQKLGTWLDE